MISLWAMPSASVCVTSSHSMGKEITHFTFWENVPISDTFSLSPSKYSSVFPPFVLFLVWKTKLLYPKRSTQDFGLNKWKSHTVPNVANASMK